MKPINGSYIRSVYTESRGMTLAEIMIAMAVFSLIASGIVGLAIQSRRMAESAIRENTAATVTQGYLEQIKSIEYSALVDAIADPGNVAIGTKTDQDTNDPIMLNVRNQKTLVINSADGTATRFMRFWITPTATNLAGTGRRAVTFTARFEWEGNDRRVGDIRTSTIRFVRSYVPTY